MKKLSFLIAIMLFLFNNAFPQDVMLNKSHDSVNTKKLNRIQKELNLSPEQLESVKVLMLENEKKNDQIKKDLKSIKDQRKLIELNTDKEMSKILSPEQYQIYHQKKVMAKNKKNDEKLKKKLAYYREELKLSDIQYNEIQELFNKTEGLKNEIKNKYNADIIQMKSELKKLKSKHMQQLKKILTKEQMQKFKQLHKP
jgi:Spy/CpxP family protein refolding chaperone